jgi:hypothetical protein
MRIKTLTDLKNWDMKWRGKDSGPWLLDRDGLIDALGGSRSTIGVYFIGYCESGKHADFDMKYCGKAVDQPLFKRLGQHIENSSNTYIREHLASKRRDKPEVWFRFMEFSKADLAELAEGTVIAAFLWNGTGEKRRFSGWTKRNEWRQHWAAEDD